MIRVYITSDAFKSKMNPARHRMIYALLKDEMAAQGGIHALQLRTRTVEEDEKAKAKEVSGS
jgi:BolA protein